MSGLSYLLITRLKNQFKEFVKTPAKIIFVVIFGTLLVTSVFSGNMAGDEQTAYRSIDELYALCFALYTLMFVMLSSKGFSSGATMFSMADVNLVFDAPFSSRKVLSYGLVQQLGQSLLLGFFILYQYGWMRQNYEIGISFLLLVLIGYGITLFLSRLAAMLIYIITSSNEKVRGIVQVIYYGIIIGYVAFLFYNVYADKVNLIGAAVKTVNSVPAWFFPVSGWTKAAVVAAFTGDWLSAAIAVAGCAAFVALCYAVITRAKADYYEDVLKATEVSFSAITAKKEGKVTEALPTNIKVGKTGFTGGNGASAFYYKHLIENRRSSRLPLSLPSVAIAAVTVAASYLVSDGTIFIFAFNIYLLMFFVGMGRWAKELTLPYAYLVPESPFKKLFWCLLESVPKFIGEGILTFVPMAFILHLSAPQVICLILARTSFGLLFIGVNLILQRLFGTSDKKVLVVLAYFAFVMIAFAPSLAGSIAVYTLIGDFLAWQVMLTMSAGNLLVFALLLFLSRNVLTYAELNNR